MRDFDHALRINPNDSHAYYVRAIVKKDTGEIQGAIEDRGWAITIAPNKPEPYATRGYIRLALGQVEKACVDWKRALRLAELNGNTRIVTDVNKSIQEHCSGK